MADIELTTDVNIPTGASLTITVYEKVTHSGQFDPSEADASASQSIGDGINTYTLSGFTGGTGNAYLVVPEATPGSAATGLSVTVDTNPGTTLSGTVVLSGSGVSGATIRVIDQTAGSQIASTTTDTNGNYSVTVDGGLTVHVTVEYEDANGNKYNDESKPFITT